MPLNAKKIQMQGGNSGPKQEPIEAGSYPARVVQVIDLGLQAQQPWQGQEKPPAHMIRLTYELVDEFCLDEEGNELEDKPRWISEDFALYSLQADKAKSTKRYFAIDPDDVNDGDFTGLIGFPCNVTVVQKKSKSNGNVYNNVGGVTSVRPKDAARMPELVNPPKVFVLDEPDMEIFQSLPSWLQEKVQANLNYQGSVLQKALEGGSEDPQEPQEPAEDEGGEEGWV